MPWAPSAQSSPPSNDRGSFQGRSGDSNTSYDQGRREQHRVYVQNIPMDMQQDSIETLFSKCGQVVSTKLLEPRGGRNTVVGFVTFSTEEAVEEAIQKMTGCTLGDGPPLRVMRPANKSNNNNQSSVTCHKCGEAGHYANKCPSGNTEENRQGGKTCFKCGEAGHFSRECPNSSGDNRRFQDNSQQHNNRFHNGPSNNAPPTERSPFGNNSRNNAPNPGSNSNHSSETNFMAMLGRGETRNTTNLPRPGQSKSFPPLKPLNTTQPMQNGYHDKPVGQGYQSQTGLHDQEEKPQTYNYNQPMTQGYQQASGQGNYQGQQGYQEPGQGNFHQPPGPGGYQEPQRFQQPANQGYQGHQQPSGPGNYQEQQGYQQPGQGNYQQEPAPRSYQEPQKFQPPSDPSNQGYQQPGATGGYQDPQTYQQQPVPGSYQEQQRYQQPFSQGHQLSGSGSFQEQAPPQDFQHQQYSQGNPPYQQPQGLPAYQDKYNQEGQPPAQQPSNYNQPEKRQDQIQPSYNQPSSVQSTFSPPDSGQAYQSASSQPGRSWRDVMASEKMNGEATRQEQSSWQQRSQSHRTSGDNVCHNCKEPGHFSRECPNPRQSGGQTCHKCGETGHFARECPNNTGGQSCHKCGELGHFSRECPNKSGPGNDQLCHRCGGAGHFARDCSEQSTNRGSGCHRCGEEGHFARECPNVAADPSRPAPVTYIPEEIDDMDTLFKDAPHFGINFERYDNIPVKVSGLNEPNPVNSFEEANFGSQCMANIKRAGYLKPTPVQKYTFPIVQGGRDLMACAQTGSGKTVAYLLPTITNMIKRGLPSASRSPLVLILAPTRELVKQIYQEARKFSDGTPIRVNEVYGGVSVAYQSQCLEQGCHFLAATPGRLLDFISREKIYLDNIQCLILDEADRMLDMGFEHDVRRIVQQSNMTDKHQRQTLMFSATFPDEVQVLAADFLKTDYLFLAVGRVGGTNLDIEQRILQVNGNDKRDRLFDILNGSGLDRTLVFVELKRVADFLACLLSENNFPTTSISSDRSQREREEALRDFRIGRANVLVATSVAARGLDIPDVKHVVNYDLPQEIDEYVHRIGRTGRIGNSGKATSFFEQGRDEKIARSLVKILSDAFQEVPAWLEQAAEDAVGSGYGPKGGRFSSRDTREGGRGRQNGHQNSGVILQNDPNSQFGSQAPDFNMQNGPSQASYSYSGDAGGSGTSYNTGRGETGPSYNTGAGTGPSYNTGRGGTGPSYNTGAGTGHSYNSGGSGSEPYSAGGGAGTSYNTSVGGAGQVYNIGGGEAGNSDDDWD